MMNYLISYFCVLVLFFCFGALADSKDCHSLKIVTIAPANASVGLPVKMSTIDSTNVESMVEFNTDGNKKSNPIGDLSLQECDCNENDANDEGSSLSDLPFDLIVQKPYYYSKIYSAPLEYPVEKLNPPPEIQ